MGHAIPKQHPAVVLRSHYNMVRALLAAAMIAMVGLTVALVIVADDDSESGATNAVQVAPAPDTRWNGAEAGVDRSYSSPVPTRKLDGTTDTRSVAPATPGTRYDGGPEEGTRAPLSSAPAAPGTRYDGGPEEGTRAPLSSGIAPDTGGSGESRSGPGFRTD